MADREPGYASETAGSAWHILTEFLARRSSGKDIPDRPAYPAPGRHARALMAKAGLEMALWDLRGKARGPLLREMLGGERERVDVGVSVGLQASPAALVGPWKAI